MNNDTGPPGVGKTHLAIARALKAIEKGQVAYFVRAYDLMEDLRKARAEHNLDRRVKVYLAPKVLIVAEFGIWPYDRDSATTFFTLVWYGKARQAVLPQVVANRTPAWSPRPNPDESEQLHGARPRIYKAGPVQGIWRIDHARRENNHRDRRGPGSPGRLGPS